MTTELAERRKGRLLSLFIVAAALSVVAAISLGIEGRASRAGAISGPVLPGLSSAFADARRISVASREASYRIEETQRGWAMRDRGDYPVQASRLLQLRDGLADLHFVRRMTSDPAKHERLGVTDPRQGGRGVLVQVENNAGAYLVDLILGVEPGGRLYVRRAGQDQVWQAESADLPPLRDVSIWLDLRPLELDAAQLARVEIMPTEGRAYILARDGADQPWRIASPALAAASQLVVTRAAQHLTEVAPTDVLEAPAIQGAPLARVRATTFDGVLIDGEIIASDDRKWLKLVARASAPEQEQAALAINNRSAAWAYAVSDIEAESLAPPLRTLVPAAAN